MRPCFAANDLTDGGPSNAVFDRQGIRRTRSSIVAETDFSNLFISQFMHCVPFSARNSFGMLARRAFVTMSQPTLLVCILRIVSRSAKEKMRRIAARRVVASMQDAQSWRDGIITDSPSDAVGQKHRVYSAVSPATDSQQTITAECSAGFPWPTLVEVAYVHFFPEPQNILRGEGRDSKMCSSHGNLLSRLLGLERLAA